MDNGMWTRIRSNLPFPSIRMPSFKTFVVAEMVVLLLLAVALTIAPQITLGWIAAAASGAREYSMAYRPVVAFMGLLLVGATVLALLATVRGGAGFGEPRPGVQRALDRKESTAERNRTEELAA